MFDKKQWAKEHGKEYRNRPEVKQRNKKWVKDNRERLLEYQKERRKKPEYKEWRKTYDKFINIPRRLQKRKDLVIKMNSTGDTVICACGCGQERPKYVLHEGEVKIAKYIKGHHMRKHHDIKMIKKSPYIAEPIIQSKGIIIAD